MNGIPVYQSWPVASVLLPTGEQHHRARVYATERGLEVYTSTTEEPAWQSPILFNRTARPSRPNLTHVGIDVETEAGLVVVTPTGQGHCCGNAMRGWSPPALGNARAWPEPERS
jgi:hypothetical protein